jgi:hypothetical protein
MKTTLRLVGVLLMLGGLWWIASGAWADDATDWAAKLAQDQKERDDWQNQLWQAQKERDDWLSKITQDNMDYGNQMRQEMDNWNRQTPENAWPAGPAAGPGVGPQVKAPVRPAAAPKAVPPQPPRPQTHEAFAAMVRQNQEQVRQRIEQGRQEIMQRRQEILQRAGRPLQPRLGQDQALRQVLQSSQDLVRQQESISRGMQ